jgi:S-adenosylmethionine decarboxylase
MVQDARKKIKLHGFNNLTKSLSFNIYDICYAKNKQEQQEYIEYIDECYNAERLTNVLQEVAKIIGANILNIARQDYDPQGASVTMLISEEPLKNADLIEGENPGPWKSSEHSETEVPGPLPETVVAHLDKSHLTVHTYPESHPKESFSTFRADIDVSTCGRVSPLKALNYLIHSFESDIVIMDYRVRGFTRDINGRKHFIDHKISSIQNFLAQDTRNRYQMIDVNVYQENIFHTKMMLSHFDMNNYLFGRGEEDYSEKELKQIEAGLRYEMAEIFYGKPINMTPVAATTPATLALKS